MSLCIDVNTVTRVLLADGWHDVADASFEIDAYEFVWSGSDRLVRDVGWSGSRDPIVLLGGGQSGICSTGFRFHTPDGRVVRTGPMTAVLTATTQCPA